MRGHLRTMILRCIGGDHAAEEAPDDGAERSTAPATAHAKQFKRHRRQLRILRSRLGRIIRDIRCKIEGEAALEEAFALPQRRCAKSPPHLHLGPEARVSQAAALSGDGDMAAAATSLSRDLRSWSCGSGSIPIVAKMCSQR